MGLWQDLTAFHLHFDTPEKLIKSIFTSHYSIILSAEALSFGSTWRPPIF
jgi:hypothetical protein